MPPRAVDVLHDGYGGKHGCYAQCVEAWTHYLKSLRTYCETGHGTPYVMAIDDQAGERSLIMAATAPRPSESR